MMLMRACLWQRTGLRSELRTGRMWEEIYRKIICHRNQLNWQFLVWQSEVSHVAETSNTTRQKCFRDRDIIKKFMLSDETRFQNKMGWENEDKWKEIFSCVLWWKGESMIFTSGVWGVEWRFFWICLYLLYGNLFKSYWEIPSWEAVVGYWSEKRKES